MSLIITRNFKRAKAQDAAAQDIKLPFIITFNNGKKEFREGYSEEEVRRRFDKSVAALYGGIKSVKLEDEDKRNGKDSIAADANFKKGDKVTVKTKWAGTRKGIVKEVINDPALKKAYVVEIEGAETAAYPAEIVSADVKDAAAADARGTDAKFQKGDKVRVWQYPVYGKMGEVVEATNGSMEYTVNVEGKDYPRIDYRRIVKVSNTAGDAAELRVVHAKGVGKWWVEPNLSRFNDADLEQTHKGRKEFPDREAAMKYARGTGKTFIVNDACDDSSGLNTSASAVAKDAYGVESKYYSGPFYPHLNDDGSIMEFRTEGEARKYIAEQELRDRMRSSSMKSYRVVRLNA